MDRLQQTTRNTGGRHLGRCQLKLVDFEVHENHALHETRGLSERHLVVRRGKPFKLTLLFRGRSWDPHSERLLLQVCLGSLTEMIPVQTYDKRLNPHKWSAQVYTGPSGQTAHPESVTVHICSPVLSSVAAYNLLVHIGTRRRRRSYAAGSFVLLCNPWLKDDPVYMPSDGQIEEYVKSDYGLVFMGTNQNVHQRPWSFGQYEPGVLEACLKLLEVSPQHLSDKNRDYTHRADPVYISRVICAMVNCNDDLGILLGKWQGSYEDGVRPTEWSGSADILRRWVSNNFSPVRYGQCWVFASVLCTVMRVLGIPSRVVTVFNAAHDGNASLTIEEFYSSTGEKLNISKDSIWNFHVWVECWMQRPDLGARFDGWQVVDPTPQEKSAGIYCCGPCPVAAVQQRCLSAPFDTSFLFASVNAEVIRFIVRNRLVVGRTVDTKCVGQLIYTKNIGSDTPEDLTLNYKRQKKGEARTQRLVYRSGALAGTAAQRVSPIELEPFSASSPGEDLPGLEVSLNINGKPSVGESVGVCVTVTNRSSRPRVLEEHVNAQVKDYNSSPQESFWTLHQEVHIQPHGALTLQHTLPSSEYESALAADNIVSLAVVIKDVQTQERVLETQEFNITSPQITIEIEGGDSIRAKKEQTARVSFTNTLTKALNGAVLTVEGSGLLSGRHQAQLDHLKPGEKIEKTVSIKATSPGTKVLMASLGHGNGHTVVSRCFRKVSVVSAS
ncbi:protein-glutamine gamma-glutamyltransferase 2-like isoform X2 [Scophthalmus maximus]|uniref:protein-glutamine gamma-glutamyltransferase 2-like isoform X2 n=1 Tax=Scophthalmus maximus TaxID=52904 RepID=UPI001FA86ADF|nr:protein-glutamine gamma-glutamyltransferase 2-like isoform X2 [Scophthalmus maximus]